MTTPVQQKIRDKKRTPEQIADMVKSGDWINNGSVGGDSTVCTEAVAKRLGPGPGQLEGYRILAVCQFLPPSRIAGKSIPCSNIIASTNFSSSPGTARPGIPIT